LNEAIVLSGAVQFFLSFFLILTMPRTGKIYSLVREKIIPGLLTAHVLFGEKLFCDSLNEITI